MVVCSASRMGAALAYAQPRLRRVPAALRGVRDVVPVRRFAAGAREPPLPVLAVRLVWLPVRELCLVESDGAGSATRLGTGTASRSPRTLTTFDTTRGVLLAFLRMAHIIPWSPRLRNRASRNYPLVAKSPGRPCRSPARLVRCEP
jgi:hypothetical protein